MTPMISLGCGWGTNTTNGCKGDPFCGFDFTLPYDVGYSYDLGGQLHQPEIAAEPTRYGQWAYAQQAAFFPSIIDTQIDSRWWEHGFMGGFEEAAKVRMDHFVAYVKGATA